MQNVNRNFVFKTTGSWFPTHHLSASTSFTVGYVDMRSVDRYEFNVTTISGTPVGSLQLSSSTVPFDFSPLPLSSRNWNGVANGDAYARAPISAADPNGTIKGQNTTSAFKVNWEATPGSTGIICVAANLILLNEKG